MRHVTARDVPVSLAEAIIALRQRLGLSQAKLGLAVGASERTVKRWERGATPKKQAVRRELIALGIDPRYFDEQVSPAAFRKRLVAAERELAALRRLLPNDEPV